MAQRSSFCRTRARLYSSQPRQEQSFVETAVTTGREFRRWLLTAIVTGVSFMPQASFARVFEVQGETTNMSNILLGPMGSASSIELYYIPAGDFHQLQSVFLRASEPARDVIGVIGHYRGKLIPLFTEPLRGLHGRLEGAKRTRQRISDSYPFTVSAIQINHLPPP